MGDEPVILHGVQQRIWDTPLVAHELATYDFGDTADKPAVFCREPAPVDCGNPHITLSLEGGDNEDMRGLRGVRAIVEMRVQSNRVGSEKQSERIAWNLWRTFHMRALTFDDWDNAGVLCGLPVSITDSDGFAGYSLTLEIVATEKES